MNLKKIIISGLAVTTIMAVSLSVCAQSLPIEAANLGRPGYTKTDIQHNTAIYEGNSRAARVVASDVWVATGPELDEAAVGYVDVKDGKTNVYHYTRAEYYRDGKLYGASNNNYGYGWVDAITYYYNNPLGGKGSAKIFYGGF